MRISSKFFIYFFNFNGILSLSLKDNILEVSKFFLIFNFSLQPVLTFVCFMIPKSLFVENVSQDFIKMQGSSRFLIIIAVSFTFLGVLLYYCVIYIQLWNQKRILSLIQSCVEAFRFSQPEIDKRLFDRFRMQCWRTLSISWLLAILWTFLNFYRTMKLSLESFLLFELLNWNYNIGIHFFALVSLFCNFFIFMLKSFNLRLERKIGNRRSLEKFAAEVSNLFKLLTDFNKLFNLLLSLSIAFFVSYLTVRVSFLFFVDLKADILNCSSIFLDW